MTPFTVELNGLRSGQITADSVTTTDAGALVFTVGGEPIAIFAARSWIAVFADGVQILWSGPAQPDQAPSKPTPRFAVHPRDR